jgi:hypothetical protein
MNVFYLSILLMFVSTQLYELEPKEKERRRQDKHVENKGMEMEKTKKIQREPH